MRNPQCHVRREMTGGGTARWRKIHVAVSKREPGMERGDTYGGIHIGVPHYPLLHHVSKWIWNLRDQYYDLYL